MKCRLMIFKVVSCKLFVYPLMTVQGGFTMLVIICHELDCMKDLCEYI